MDTEANRKRGVAVASANVNGGFKKYKSEMESFSSGIGSKSKPCTKFFSTTGCQFGEACHFMHYVPGGIKAVMPMTNLGGNPSAPAPARYQAPPVPFNGSSPSTLKSRLCNKYSTAEGCRFGERCNFAHGEWELGKPMQDSHGPGRYTPAHEPPVSGFGASANVKISVDASLVGAILGKGGVNSKHVCRVTGVRLVVHDHESDTRLRNIELEGTLEQIKQASEMVSELIGTVRPSLGARVPHVPANNFRTKMCENFANGSCSFGDRCHFAHGLEELRNF